MKNKSNRYRDFYFEKIHAEPIGLGRVFDWDILNTMNITKALALGQGTNLTTLVDDTKCLNLVRKTRNLNSIFFSKSQSTLPQCQPRYTLLCAFGVDANKTQGP